MISTTNSPSLRLVHKTYYCEPVQGNVKSKIFLNVTCATMNGKRIWNGLNVVVN